MDQNVGALLWATSLILIGTHWTALYQRRAKSVVRESISPPYTNTP